MDTLDFNTLNGPKMTEEQIKIYLDRLGLSGPVTLDLDGLTRLQQAHQQAVAFENLDILAGRPLSLDHETLFDKLILRRRGGVCAELNTLYNWLLWSLGFQVTSYNSRIASYGKIEFRRHRVMGVKLGSETYTTDAGFTTECARIPLHLAEGEIQDDGFCRYEYRRDPFYGWLQMQQKPGEDWWPSLGFTEEPQIDMDFDTAVYWFAHNPDSVMTKCPRVSIYTKDSIIAVRNHAFRVEKSGLPEIDRPIADWEEEKRIIREKFGLPTDGIG